jgi:glycosyltransferase involved in cell wall biosynthesis
MTTSSWDTVLILTPMKNATPHLAGYWAALDRLDYPADRLSLGILESDSTDGTAELVRAQLAPLRQRFAAVTFWQKHFNFQIPSDRPRWDYAFQLPRRKILAKSRNHLLFRTLEDQDWVLWLDVDVIDYPPDLLQQLLATGRDILHPHCVTEPGGPSFDRNAWRDHGKIHLDQLRGGPDLVRLDSVGGTVLLIRADIHRDGLVFPSFPYGGGNPAIRQPHPLGAAVRGEIETEGLGIMAGDMGHQCWGMPNLEVRHERN